MRLDMKKRGLVLVVAIVLLLLFSNAVLAEYAHVNDQKTLALGKIGGSGGVYVGKEIVLTSVSPPEIKTGDGELECNNVADDLNSLGNKGDPRGCFVGLIIRNLGKYDDGAVGYTVKGQIFDHLFRNVGWVERYAACGSEDARLFLDDSLFSGGDVNKYICAEDSFWHICKDDRENTEGTENTNPTYYGSLAYGEDNSLYNCTITDKDVVDWVKLPGVDRDQDLFTDEAGDCQDDPTIDPVICLEREDATECGVKYASCASCINSGATEVCGDGIDNSCRLNGGDVLKANDDCDFKAYQNECKVDFNSLPDPQSNAELNLCCGDDGITDLGEKIKAKSGNYLCLKKDQALVSLGNGADIAGVEANEADKWSAEGWKWVRASGDAKFTIYTIKKPGEAVYDIASDGGDWQQCSVGSEGKMGSQFDKENGDKFYCYASGDQWSWAECCSKEGSCTSKDINGVKIRNASQGTLNLMSLLNTEKNNIRFGQPGGFFSSEDTTLYETIYGQQYPSFAGYDYVDIYFDFSGETIEAGTALQMEVWSTTGKIASENVLANVINGATLQTKKVYHAQIPISGWRDITLITFKTTPTTVPVEIKNIQVVKKDTNPICSGSNTWLNDIDEKDEAIEEGKMCKDLGLTWLGNDAVNRCCGDDQSEYGVGSKGGCWNSQGIVSAQTVNDLKVELTYGKGVWMYDSASVEVSTSVEIKTSGVQLSLLTDINGVKCEDKGGYKICYTDKASVKPNDLTVIGGNLVKHIGGFNPFDLPVDLSSNGYTCQLLETYTFCYDNSIDLKDKLFYLKNNQINIKSFTTSVTTTPPYSETITSAAPTKIGDSIEFTKTNFIEATLKDSNGGKVFFFNPLDDPTSMDEERITIKYEDLTQEKTVYYIMAKVDTLKQTYIYNPSTTETVTYSCTTATCTFPLKGSPPYTIKNIYPAKYDLYFVNVVDGKETRTFINPEKTIYATSGWLEVDNVPQQVVFNGTVFFGCGDTTALGTVPLVNQNICFAQKTTTDGFYCAPDYGWKKDALSTMIYDNDNKLQLLSPEVLLKPEDRNHTSSIVFGRNILLNPMLDLTK